MLSKFSREPREMPWEPNLGKNKPKLPKFQFCARNRELFCMNNRVFGVHKFKYAIRIIKEAWQPNLDKNEAKLHEFHFCE